MEKISIGQLHGRISHRILARLGLAAVLAVTGFAVGCGKSGSTVVQAATEQSTNQTSADQTAIYQQPLPAVAATAAAQPLAEPDLKELNRNLLRWVLGNRRRPQNFEDFAATAGMTIPPPPAGKKYVLGKDMHILLVDR